MRMASPNDYANILAHSNNIQGRNVAIHFGSWQSHSLRQLHRSVPIQTHLTGSGIPSRPNDGTWGPDRSSLNANAPIFSPVPNTQTAPAPSIVQCLVAPSTTIGVQSSATADTAGAVAIPLNMDTNTVGAAFSIEADHVEARQNAFQDSHQSQWWNNESQAEVAQAPPSPYSREDRDEQTADAGTRSRTRDSTPKSSETSQKELLSSRTSLDVMDGSVQTSTQRSAGSSSTSESNEEIRLSRNPFQYCASWIWGKRLNQTNILPRKFQSGRYPHHCESACCTSRLDRRGVLSACEGFQALDDYCQNTLRSELLQGSEVEPRSPSGKLISDGSFGAIGEPLKPTSAYQARGK